MHFFSDYSDINVTFINMPLRESAMPTVTPEGPLILAAILRNLGANVSIIDLNAYRIQDDDSNRRGLVNGRHMNCDEVENLINDHLNFYGDQHLIALSGKITTLKWQQIVAKIIKRVQPSSFLVTGNGLATEIKSGLFNWIPELDAIGRSEGDDVILSIINDAKLIFEIGIDKAIKNTKLSPYYVGSIHGKPRFIYEGGRPKHLDNIPTAAIDLLEKDVRGVNILEKYIQTPVWGLAANNSSATPFSMKRSLTTVSSRGCPYACAFCYRGSQGERNYGMRSVDHLMNQINHYVDKYNIDFLGFVDDNFAVDKRRIHLLPAAFKKNNIDIKWGTHTRMDEADERASYMADAGCTYIGFGAESASEHTITQMKKGGHILKNGIKSVKVNGSEYKFPVTMINAVNNCKKNNIHANCTWIMGYPGEGLEHLQTSIAFILWQQENITKNLSTNSEDYLIALNSVNTNVFTATAYPGTELWNVVRPKLRKHFNISFAHNGLPECDKYFYNYVLELDDATKVLNDKNNEPVYYGSMKMDDFLLARDYVDSGQINKILSM
jgi:radical SAM superfamily enzyme YgiQ (UPF0313 family)